MALAVSLRSAVALLGAVPAIAGVDLDIDDGTVACALGPNGAGKTSLLLVLAGLLALRSGSGSVLGVDLATDAAAVRRQVGLLGHHLMGYPELSAHENLVYGLRAQRRDPADATAALARVGLVGRLATVPARALSAGQQRRMGLAWLVARRPALWLLDEPHASLDESGRALCDELVVEAADHGATVVFTSHDPVRAGLVADRLVELRGGAVVEVRRGERAIRVA